MIRDPKLLMAVAGVVVLAIIAVLVVLFPRSTETKDDVKNKIIQEAREQNPAFRNIPFANNERYAVWYYETSDEFLITINAAPVAGVRLEAEQFFLALVGDNKKIACELNTTLVVTKWADPSLAGVDLGLSFCEQ